MADYLKEDKSAATGQSQSVSKTSTSSPVQVMLPQIELPSFDGVVLSWQTYYQSLGVSIVDNSGLADVQKLEYIMRSLKGTAADAVKGFSVVQENYWPVLDTLKERFGHLRLIVDAHIRSLIHLPRLVCEVVSMRKFYDQVSSHVRSVEYMGEKFSSEILAPVLVPMIVDKLPKRVVEKWEIEIGDRRDESLPVKISFTSLE